MEQTRPTDLASFRRIALFTVVLAAAIGVTVPVFRIGMPPLWAPILASWFALAAALLLPIAILDWRLPERSGWTPDMLVGPAVVAGLVIVELLGLLGTIGYILIGIAALVGLGLAIRREIGQARAGRMIGWLVLVVALWLPLIGALHGTKYANFIADQLMLWGRTDGDTLFHGALINSLRYFGTIATGIDGIHPFGYHVGVHFLAGRIADLSGVQAVPALMAVRAILISPLLVFAIAAGGILWARVRGGGPERPMLAIAGSLLLNLGLPVLQIGVGSLNSESLVLAAAILALVWPSFLIAANNTGTDRGPGMSAAAWTGGLLLILLLGAAKVSFGLVWAGIIGWWALRKLGLRRTSFWVVAILSVGGFVSIAMLFSTPGTESGAKVFGTPFYLDMMKHGYPLFPILVNLEGIAVMVIMGLVLRRAHPDRPAERRWARDVIESLAVVFVIANLPGLVLKIAGGDTIYFVQIFGWVAKPLLLGEILRLPELRPSAMRNPPQRVGVALTWIGTVACVVGLMLVGIRQARLAIDMEAAVRTGNLDYYSSAGSRAVRTNAKRALRKLGIAGVLTTAPAAAPGAALADALIGFRQSAGPAGGLYVPPSLTDYWSLQLDCNAKGQFPMAASGVPMIDGYNPDPTTCKQGFSLLGYSGLPDDFGKSLDDAGICAHAKADGLSRVLVLTQMRPDLQTRELACKP